MGRPLVRYAARRTTRSPGRDGDGGGVAIRTWSTSLNATFLTDPEVAASVLPPPLEPAREPLVKVGISHVDLGRRMPPIGAGTVAVAARHDGHDGFYPLFMPMTTEQAVTGGREIFGEPKKLARIRLDITAGTSGGNDAGEDGEVDADVDDREIRPGSSVAASVSRMGTTVIEITGSIGEALALPAAGESLDFYVKLLRDPAGDGLDGDPWLVYCTRAGETRRHHRVAGSLTFADSRFDPVADIPICSEPVITVSERTSNQTGRLVQQVPARDVLPYVHQRYDDLMAAVAKDV